MYSLPVNITIAGIVTLVSSTLILYGLDRAMLALLIGALWSVLPIIWVYFLYSPKVFVRAPFTAGISMFISTYMAALPVFILLGEIMDDIAIIMDLIPTHTQALSNTSRFLEIIMQILAVLSTIILAGDHLVIATRGSSLIPKTYRMPTYAIGLCGYFIGLYMLIMPSSFVPLSFGPLVKASAFLMEILRGMLMYTLHG